MLKIETWPELRDPALVIALSGWIDAGMAGAGASAVISEQLESQRRFGAVDLADLMDLQQSRPTVTLRDGVSRDVEWPSIDLTAGRLGRDVVQIVGPEPSLRWRAVLGELVDVAQRLGVRRAFTLGGFPSVVSHRRPINVIATASDESLAAEVGAWRSDFVGPTGAQGVLQVLLGQAGVPTVGLWAQVPHYLAGGPSPPAIRALLERLSEFGGIQADVATLESQESSYVSRVEEGLSERPDVAEVVRAIEETPEGDEALPSGDELASEIERFLREQS